MKSPTISVIMSVYNGLPYLKEAVKSILSQTYKNFEFIIVDDASTDTSFKYLKSLKDRRIKLIRNNKNYGLARSLNIALGMAVGDYIARMDADDVSMPARFKEQLDFMKKHQGVDLCGAAVTLIDKNGKVLGKLRYPSSFSEIRKKFILFNPIIHPTFFAKREIFLSLGGYNHDFDGAEDYELLARGLGQFKYANIPRTLLKQRISKSRRSYLSMHRMDMLDLKVKLKMFKGKEFSLLGFYAITKKFFFTYMVPAGIKVKIMSFFKLV
jgi:glycosyltransferase involved in cell wall biosynthesis